MTTKPHTQRSIHLGLLLHNHQPVGNFPWVFQQVYESSYLPLIEALERHPGVHLSLHYTGSLIDWLEESQPEFLQRVARLVACQQIEMVGGGYYEPILPAIPDGDKLAQIQRLSERIESHFGQKPTGMWLAERVWEPSLPRALSAADIQWTILDDIHFKNVGLEDHDLYGYYATEDQTGIVKVYATSQALRYTIPWRPPEETIKTLHKLATLDGQRIVVMGDDGEKFGAWPDTQTYCWGTKERSGWVEQFFTALEENSDWLHTIALGTYANQHAALGRAYLPTASYIEMTEWALPPKKSYQFGQLLHQLEKEHRPDILQFMRGGFWRSFLVRYAEINNQHKKMLHVHDLVYAAGANDEAGLTHLLKAQANDTYWHGLFGGIYMAHVRSAIYHHLIKAENAAAMLTHGNRSWQHYTLTDFERNTRQQLLIESDQQNLYFDPEHGGSLFEWDLRRSAHNLLCVMTRRQESYHQTLRIYEQERRRTAITNAPIPQSDTDQPDNPHSTIRTKESDLDQYLVIDPYRRSSLIDHFLPSGLPLESYAQMRYEEQGTFANQPYAAHVTQGASDITVLFDRIGEVKRPGALNPLMVHLSKTIQIPLGEEKLIVRYRIENQGQARLQTNFATEWNLNLLGGGNNPQAYMTIEGQEEESQYFDSTGEHHEAQAIHVGNSWLQQDIGFVLSVPATLWHFSIDTVTGSEAGFERTHQGSNFTFLWPLLLEGGQVWEVEMTIQGRIPH
ncbi:alpha-amylase/4-alpha-glucanotransferase domain-containing protein [Dictyobacter arantiisoli]|uniref:Alpha-amylase n=1 Tax=Dictyobacter arantiisoli TaxID=2014874 RepID=A0A5A5T8L7_9CHLR|nr:alpha-amylase/4-alpha-glucanotransferase domain-containing protein [Dictyobacter arantiisoli]GCF07697.1 alpha-amylase [Dictyobacter arantiisoli]